MTTNPEKLFKETPQSFSETSKILKIAKEEEYKGIILNNIDEVCEALMFYESGKIISMREHADMLKKTIEHHKKEGYLPIEMAPLAKIGFFEQLTKRVRQDLEKRQYYGLTGDFYTEGTNLDKKEIRAWLTDGKYILQIDNGYHDKAIAEKLRVEQSLYSATTEARFSIVDKYWINVDLQKTVEGLNIPEMDAEKLGKRICGPLGGEDYKIDGLYLQVHYKGNSGSVQNYKQYLQSRGRHIVGPAWNQSTKALENPGLAFTITNHHNYRRSGAATEKEKGRMLQLRDKIAHGLESLCVGSKEEASSQIV